MKLYSLKIDGFRRIENAIISFGKTRGFFNGNK